MILFVTLSVSLATATALLVHQYRSRALAGGDAAPDGPAERDVEERRAA